MGAPSRFSNGLNSSSGLDATNMMGQIDPSYYHTLFDDFEYFTAANWTITRVGTTPTEALVAGDGGLLLLTTSAGAADSTFLQDPIASFTVAAGFPIYAKMLLRLSDANLSSFVFGLQNVNTAPLTASATNGLFITKGSGVSNLSLISRSGGVSQTVVSSGGISMTNAVNAEVGFAYDGKTQLDGYFNGVKVASIPDIGTLPAGNLALVFGLQNGAAAIKTLTADYILAAKSR